MQEPLVSFVVPCYKLGHLLSECVNSILSQTYENLEIFIMNDNSPDNTAVVAESFSDRRVKHIRNKQNLGHLGNYNHGIGLCSGKYVWLISADDYLKSRRVLEKYVGLMETHPKVGYTFCPGIGVSNGEETEVLQYSVYRKNDCIVTGHEFLDTLLNSNLVIAASALVRKECYDKISMFPLTPEMEWSGDWYLWCAFAMIYEVGFFAEPMVCYRTHALSMTTQLAEEASIHKCSEGDLAVPLMIMKTAKEMRLPAIEKRCLLSVADEYVRQCRSKAYQSAVWSLNTEQFEQSLNRHIDGSRDRDWIRARVYSALADKLWRNADKAAARNQYLASIRKDPRRLPVYLKLALLSLGISGDGARTVGRRFRNFSFLRVSKG